ncbi:hypothetical protein ROZALSC1DRAFT_21504 [Rozella allomycis CSF55]|uniref:Uncharacterized protein n=1 Tax=Rozella allomycis (strain CSF55) TaxID=988480 RepID=A0A4P9YMX7_ROZAC|nr:hypothetical protein ROZALSC1DRAFT_21504 [Rozella allomycis CSF55]
MKNIIDDLDDLYYIPLRMLSHLFSNVQVFEAINETNIVKLSKIWAPKIIHDSKSSDIFINIISNTNEIFGEFDNHSFNLNNLIEYSIFKCPLSVSTYKRNENQKGRPRVDILDSVNFQNQCANFTCRPGLEAGKLYGQNIEAFINYVDNLIDKNDVPIKELKIIKKKINIYLNNIKKSHHEKKSDLTKAELKETKELYAKYLQIKQYMKK